MMTPECVFCDMMTPECLFCEMMTPECLFCEMMTPECLFCEMMFCEMMAQSGVPLPGLRNCNCMKNTRTQKWRKILCAKLWFLSTFTLGWKCRGCRAKHFCKTESAVAAVRRISAKLIVLWLQWEAFLQNWYCCGCSRKHFWKVDSAVAAVGSISAKLKCSIYAVAAVLLISMWTSVRWPSWLGGWLVICSKINGTLFCLRLVVFLWFWVVKSFNGRPYWLIFICFPCSNQYLKKLVFGHFGTNRNQSKLTKN